MALHMTLTTDDARQLDEQGWLILRDVIDPAWLQALRDRTQELLRQEGAQAGGEFRQEAGSDRLANLVDKGVCFE